MEKNDWFDKSQEAEREKLKLLFEKFLKYNGCSNLTHTSENEFSRFDALMLSGHSNVIIEMKVRKHEAKKYGSCLIEFSKFQALKEWCEAGNKVLYIVDYFDYYIIWLLNPLYDYLKNLDLPLHYHFYSITCPDNSSGNGTLIDKRVSILNTYQASYIIDKSDYSLISYPSFLLK